MQVLVFYPVEGTLLGYQYTSSGVEEVQHVYWLLEDLDADGEIDLPRSGMTAPTGLDGDGARFLTIRIRRAPAIDSDENSTIAGELKSLTARHSVWHLCEILSSTRQPSRVPRTSQKSTEF